MNSGPVHESGARTARMRTAASQISTRSLPARAGPQQLRASQHRPGAHTGAKVSHPATGLPLSQVPVAPIQFKRVISAPSGADEHEADNLADAVMQMPDRVAAVAARPVLQRKCTGCEDEEKEPVRTKHAPSASSGSVPDTGAAVSAAGRGGTPLPPQARSFFERRFGRDFTAVRLHTGADAAAGAQAVQARAYTIGNDIVFGAGEFAPATSQGKWLLAHELAHTLQQAATVPHRKIQRRQVCDENGACHEEPDVAPGPSAPAGPAQQALPGGSAAVSQGAATEAATPPAALTSPRFSGDPQLAEVAAGRLRLAAPGTGPYPAPMLSTGPAVSKIQQALVDLAYDIGGTGPAANGVDGAYGPKTAAAVRQFKADNKLGFEQFGDVGPGTMGRLDILFPDTTEKDPTALKDDPAVCPFTDESAVDQVADSPRVHALIAAGVPGGISAGPATPVHVGIDDSVKLFEAAVNPVIPATIGSPDLTASGQFFWFEQIRAAIDERLKSLNADKVASEFAGRARVFVAAMIKRESGVIDILHDLDRIVKKKKSSQKSVMLSLLAPPAEPSVIIENHLYQTLNADPTSRLPLRDLDRLRSLRTLLAVFNFDSHSCGYAASQVVKRLALQTSRGGGIKPRSPNAPRIAPTYLATGTAIRDRRPGPSADYLRGDLIDQTGVASAVVQMRAAIDGGRQIHARVLSGVGYGGDAPVPDPHAKLKTLGPPQPEHSLIIIGYDDFKFVFSDPDATVSHSPKDGFGFLYVDTHDRLSTAPTESDLYVYSNGDPTDDRDGTHVWGDHRYQVISLATFD